MGVLKKYVHNRARPEGSISKGYGTEEVIEFCVDFIPGIKSIGLSESRHEGRLSGKGTLGMKSSICRDGYSFTQAHYPKRSKETHDPCASDPTAHKRSKETHDPCDSDPTAHKRSKETHDPCASLVPVGNTNRY